MTPEHELYLYKASKDSDLCAIVLLHRWGLPHPKKPDLIGQKSPTFLQRIDPLLKELRRLTYRKRSLFATRHELKRMIDDLNPKLAAKSRA